MLKTSLIAASMLMLASGGAFAQQGENAPYSNNQYAYGNGPDSFNAFTGTNQYCAPGEIPDVFPFGTGVRCELPTGGYHYN